MKVICIIILVIAVASARSVIQQDLYFKLPECPMDLLHFVQAAANVTFDPVLNLLVGSTVENFVMRGLKTFRYNTRTNFSTAFVDVSIAQFTGNGLYNAEGYLDVRPIRQETLPSGNLTGSGLAQFSATNVKILANLDAFLNLQGKIQFSRLELQEVSFDSLELWLGPNFLIAGEPVNWPEFNRNVKSNFYRDLAENQAAIEERLREATNILFKKLSLQDLIALPLPRYPTMCPL